MGTPAPRGGNRALDRTKSRDSLPKTWLPGTVLAQWVRCSRPNCRCAQGELHGPYHSRFWWEDGRLRKVYVRPAELDEVRARCEARRRARRTLQDGWDTWRALRAAVREVEGT
jgi:hypothetical protein